jgi:hypothetical protein
VTLFLHKGYEMEKGDKWVESESGSHEEKVIKDLLKKIHAEQPGISVSAMRISLRPQSAREMSATL